MQEDITQIVQVGWSRGDATDLGKEGDSDRVGHEEAEECPGDDDWIQAAGAAFRQPEKERLLTAEEIVDGGAYEASVAGDLANRGAVVALVQEETVGRFEDGR